MICALYQGNKNYRPVRGPEIGLWRRGIPRGRAFWPWSPDAGLAEGVVISKHSLYFFFVKLFVHFTRRFRGSFVPVYS